MPLLVRLAVARGLVEAHGVGEAGLEEVVVAGGGLLEDVGERGLLAVSEFGQRADVALRQDEGFKGPDGPPRDNDEEVVVLANDADLFFRFDLEVVAEQAGVFLGELCLERFGLLGGLVGDVLGGPDLAVGMGIAGAHHGAAVLEDLHVVELGLAAEFNVLLGPGVDDAGARRRVPCAGW